MIFVCLNLLVFLTLTWLLLAFSCVDTTMLTAANITKPGCARKCGNLTIPYPFGLSKGCAMADDYILTCHTENNSSKTWFGDTTSEVLHISDTQLLIAAGPVDSSCNTAEAGDSNVFGGLDVSSQPYALSSTANKFVVTGCYHYGLMEAETRSGRQVLSCVALCTKKEDLLDGTCSGVGCCQAPIPKGLQKFNTTLEKIYYSSNASVSSANCSYSFIVERSSFNFRGAIDLQDPKFPERIENLPVVLDWFVKNNTCWEAQRNSNTYACQKNTICIDLNQVLNIQAYRCKCHHGYEGNPYLSPGCTDIDECREPNNPCSNICVNTQGSYNCYCPSGYHGDGKKDGIGCLPISVKLVITLGLGIGLGSIFFLLSGFWLVIVAQRRKKRIQRAKNFKRNGGLLLEQQMFAGVGMMERTRIFTADELEKATDHFNDDRVLGRGGQGTVYKGMLSDGNIVAIKKSKVVGQRHLNEFINELVVLSQINHRSIVKLLGSCLETEVPLLVYEFIPNGPLSNYIHDPSEDFPFTWEMRLQIAVDVAGALAYLHSASSKPIFHRDIKASNILLDAKYRAKLSDFGISRSVDIDQTHLTTRVQGTFGYLDPEYFRTNQFTEKSDVYSFGVVLVELLTGQKAIRPTESPCGKSLVSWFLLNVENSDLYDILEAQVANNEVKETIISISNLAKQCLNINGRQRPTMREVALELEMINQLHHVPVSFHENPPKAIDQKLTEMTETTSSSRLPSSTTCTEEEFSSPK